MIQSMTGYGVSHGGQRDAQRENQKAGITVEMRSVNHRFLDISIKAPSTLLRYEMAIRRLLQEHFFRGHIDVFVTIMPENTLVLNNEFIKNTVTVLRQIKSDFALGGEIDLATVLSFKEALINDPKEIDEGSLMSALIDAINMLKQMRIQEGQLLLQEMLPHVDYMEELLDKISSLSIDATMRMFDKTKQKMRQLLNDLQLDESRILQEAATYAEKIDISEEIERLRSHIKQFGKNLSINDKIGKKLDFILQELYREANTITAKTDDFEIKTLATDLKLQTEKLREQVQNVQ
ncbi:MAG: YicC family protein [Nitrospirae bacterium]|nr:YicC family protein [Nitrospirota bacterium]MBF0591616.1 YicC family protein [Nitrospirota bacterium]